MTEYKNAYYIVNSLLIFIMFIHNLIGFEKYSGSE